MRAAVKPPRPGHGYGRNRARLPRHGRNRLRLTRRGRVTVTAAGALAAAALVALAAALALPDGSSAGRPATLTVRAGWRSGQVYEAVDRALGLSRGTTRRHVPKTRLALPTQAHGNPEGYLRPAAYRITAHTTPESLLTAMVKGATKEFRAPLAASARINSMNGYQTVVVASLVQAEAGTPEDMRRMARVVYNRLARGMPLQLDSTVAYALDRPGAHISERDTHVDSPYNSYRRAGLPPTPIGSPGTAALRAAADPAPGDWLYHVTVAPGDTRFSSTYEEQLTNAAEARRQQDGSRTGS